MRAALRPSNHAPLLASPVPQPSPQANGHDAEHSNQAHDGEPTDEVEHQVGADEGVTAAGHHPQVSCGATYAGGAAYRSHRLLVGQEAAALEGALKGRGMPMPWLPTVARLVGALVDRQSGKRFEAVPLHPAQGVIPVDSCIARHALGPARHDHAQRWLYSDVCRREQAGGTPSPDCLQSLLVPAGMAGPEAIRPWLV